MNNKDESLMNLRSGIQVLDQTPALADPAHVQALQTLGAACWKQRARLVKWDKSTMLDGTQTPRMMFVYISGGVLQVDVDCCARADKNPLEMKALFTKLLGEDHQRILDFCCDAYDAFFADTLHPAARLLFGDLAPGSSGPAPGGGVCLLPGRKLLLSGMPGAAQLLHLDSHWPTLVGNVYLRPRGHEHRALRATIFPEEPDLGPAAHHPRDLRTLEDTVVDGTLGKDSPMWSERKDAGPCTMPHNSAVLFCGNVVHGGPHPQRGKGAPRIVMFQHVRPAWAPADDLSDFQDFEFSLCARRYGASERTRRALQDTGGRWRDHITDPDSDPVYREFQEL
jgi:hypothetical protein